MAIHLPQNVENALRDAVASGYFTPMDEEAVAEAVRSFLHRQQAASAQATVPQKAEKARKPIWEEIADITASIPDEEWAKLPVDGAEQHDHYIYGTPKRPPRS